MGDEDPFHVTVCYGFDEKFHLIAVDRVSRAELKESDIRWGRVYTVEPPHLASKRLVIVAVEVISDKIDALKGQIKKETSAVDPGEEAAKKDGRKIPLHVTLMILRLPESK